VNNLADDVTRDLPEGTVTFLFTDIEGSTQLLRTLGERYKKLLADHHQIARAIFSKWNGREVDTEGDAFFASFPRAYGADYPDPDSFMRTFAANCGTWEDTAFKTLVNQARCTDDQNERISLYHEADRILVEAAAIIPMTYLRWHWLAKPWVRSRLSELLDHRWKDVVIEPH